MGFQTRVNAQPAPAVAGDFAGTNPRMSVTAPPNGYKAAPDYPVTFGGPLTEALVVGRFAWFNYATDDSVVDGQLPAGGLASNYFQPNSVLGFVHREDQTVITKFLAEQRMGVQQGFPVTGVVQGDVWADFLNSTPATAGQVVYADPVTGQASAGTAGQSVVITGATGAIAAATGIMTIAGAPSGTVAVGQVVVGAGIPAGTFITALISSTGGTGTVQLNQAPAGNISAETITLYGKQQTRWKLAQPVQGAASFTGQFLGSPGTYFAGTASFATNVMTVTAENVGSSGIRVGDVVVAAGVTAGTTVTSFGTGSGGLGTYNLSTSPGTIAAEQVSTTRTIPDGKLTVSGSITNGPIQAGMLLSGANGDLPSYSQILGQISGTTGGDGVYNTNVSIVQGASETMTAAQGTLGKISTWQA